MPLRITTLCENTATYGYTAEWGLSYLVEVNGFTFLMDTGMTGIGVQNGVRSNVAFGDIDAVVLSHGHLDHTGGLGDVLARTGPVQVVAHPDVFHRKYSERRTPPDEDIGIPLSAQEIAAAGGELRLSREPVELAPGIFTSGEVPMVTPFEQIDGGLLFDDGKGRRDDPLLDDLSVAACTPKGLFVFLGCAHRGPVNIIRHLQEVTGESRVYGVTGGLHLSRASDERIGQTVDFFKEIGVKKIACSHCTGFEATVALDRAFGSDFIHNHAGRRMFFN